MGSGLAFHPKTEKTVGATVGPTAKVGVAQTNSTTGRAGLQGLLEKINIFKPAGDDKKRKPEEPKLPKSQNEK